jgi:hypothetical protein
LRESAQLGHFPAAASAPPERWLAEQEPERGEVSEYGRYFRVHLDGRNTVRRKSGGVCLEVGDEVARDFSLAVQYFKRLADERGPWGHLTFGICCESEPAKIRQRRRSITNCRRTNETRLVTIRLATAWNGESAFAQMGLRRRHITDSRQIRRMQLRTLFGVGNRDSQESI